MADKLALIQEAAKRGILPADMQPYYDEAVKRGLISGTQQSSAAKPTDAQVQQNAKTAQQLVDRAKMSAAGPFGPIINAVGDYAQQGLSGFNEGLANVAGLPSLAANIAVNAVPAVSNKVFGTNLPTVDVPDTGKMTRDFMTSTGMISPPSDKPDQQFVRKIGETVGSIVPLAGAGAVEAIPTAITAGIGGATAQQIAPGNPWAELAGELAGGLTPAALKKIGSTFAVAKTAPTAEELQQLKNAAYKTADNLGVRYTGPAYQSMADDIEQTVTAANISPTRHPKAFSFVRDLQKRMTGSAPSNKGLPAKINGLSLTELDQLRQEARRDLLRSSDAAEQEFGRKIVNRIDDFIANAGAGDVSAGSATDANAAITAARELNTRYRKTELIEDAIYRANLQTQATGSGGNINNALRQQIKNLLLNKDERAAFSADEIAQMEDAVKQGAGENLLRLVGKLSPGGNGLMTALSIGGAAANPALAVAPIAGALAKGAADRITVGKVNSLRASVARGSGAALTPTAPAMSPRAGVALSLGMLAANQNEPQDNRGNTLKRLRANALN